MIDNGSETELNISEKKLEDVLLHFLSLMFDSVKKELPDSIADIPDVQRLSAVVTEIRSALNMAKNGDFSFTINSKGFVSGCLKALQSHLNHIAWLARQVADGDFDHRMHFMGEFSSAFNSMTEQLANVYKRLNEQNKELNELNKILSEQKDHFSYRALHDPLTGLKNRAYYDEQIINEIARAKRSNTLLAVVIVDMDKFKSVNDTMGHQAGDALLIEVSNRLLKGTREIDTVARLGGDEFGMLWPSYTSNKQHFSKIKDRVISHINSHFELGGSDYEISVSMGISIYPFDGEDPQTLMKVADGAMYQAKQIFRTSCVFASLDRLNMKAPF
jgi:diguanylate cyclase (GGDEF)-like protein